MSDYVLELDAPVADAPSKSIPPHLVTPLDWYHIARTEAARLGDGPVKAAKAVESLRYQSCAALIDALTSASIAAAERANAAKEHMGTTLERVLSLRERASGPEWVLQELDELIFTLRAAGARAPAPAAKEVLHEEVESFDAG